MFIPPASPWTVPFEGGFDVRAAPTAPPADAPHAKRLRRELRALVREFDDIQRKLYTEDRHALLLVFQALDAAGKDSTIRAVLRGVNPAGVHVTPFGRPSSLELRHDFLWRTARHLPERGHVGVFNRSYYEEVLVVRVHPELLGPQRLPEPESAEALWRGRLESIRDHERHLARNGVIVLKFWLNVSKDEQTRRLLSRLDEREKHWKFEMADVREREYHEEYLDAYAAVFEATSRPWAPWYAIPADDKPFMRRAVAEIVVDALRALEPDHPHGPAIDPGEAERIRARLAADLAEGDART